MRDLRLLLLEDDDNDAVLFRRHARKMAADLTLHIDQATTVGEGLERLDGTAYDAVCTDYRLGAEDAIHFVTRARDLGYDGPILILTGSGTQEMAVAAMQAGATDYLVKANLNPASLERALLRALDLHQQERRRRHAEQALASLHETALAVMDRFDLEPLLEALVARAALLLGAPNAFLYLERPDASVLECRVWHGSRPMDPQVAPNEGAVGCAWKRGEVVVIQDYDTWPGRSPQVERGIFGAMLAVPIKLAGRVAGALGVAQDFGVTISAPRLASPRASLRSESSGDASDETLRFDRSAGPSFDGSQARLLSSFAQLASIALDNARLFQQEHRAREAAERLLAATRALSSTMDLERVFEVILRELETVVPSDSASIQELRGDRLHIVGGRGFAASFIGHSFDPAAGDGRSREVLERGEPVVRDAPFADGLFAGQEARGLRSWMGVPLLFGTRTLGLLVLDKQERGFFSAEHARLASGFAAQAAIAIENSRLYTAARHDEARYRSLFEHSVGLICTHDPDGRLLTVNPAAAEALGYAPGEMVGRNLREFVPESVQQGFDDYLKTVNGEGRAAGTLLIQNRGGEDRLWRYRNVVHQLADGPTIIGFAQDVTDEARAQAAVGESEERYRTMLEGLPIGAYRTTPDGRILAANAALVRMLGHASLEDMTRRNLEQGADFEPEYDRAEFRSRLEREGEVAGLEARWRRRDGSFIDVREHARAVRGRDGAICYYEGTVEDVSARREAEQMRQDLTHTMVHDLRSPLTSISSGLEFLLMDPNVVPPPKRKILEAAGRGAGRMLELLNAILDVSRLEAGAMPVVRESVAIPVLVQEVFDLARPLAQETEVSLVWDDGSGIPSVVADRSLLFRVLQNLVGNAVKFTPRGGQVTVSACTGGETPSLVTVRVRDTGEGVPEEVKPRLFRKFSSGSQKARGSGLGLAFCRLAVEAQGGTIWLENGPGAAFGFSVPAVDDAK